METPTSKASSPNYYCSTKDTMYTKLFVGGLPYHTCDKTLREHFEQYGDIDEAVVITDKSTNKSRGYGFVTMSDREGAQRAVANPNPVIDGRKANVNLAFLGAKQRGGPAVDYPASLQQFLALKAAGWPGCGFVQAGQNTPAAYPTGYASPYNLPLYYPGLIPYPTASASSNLSQGGNTGQQFWDYNALANAQATETAAAQLAFPYMAAAAANPLAAAHQQALSPMSYAYIPTTAQTIAAQAAYQSQQMSSADQLH